MYKKAIWAVAVVACLVLAAPAAVRAQGDYLDEGIVKVKPDKVAEFTAVVKKITDANRRFNGDRWLGMETMYGESDTYVFVSIRKDYADVDKGNDAFTAALEKAYGKEGAAKLLRDEESCLESSRNELRRRRWDLSRKAPADAAAYAKLVGESRVLRTTAVHVRSGHIADFEALLKEVKEAGEKNPDTQPVFVSQVVEGTKGTTFYVTTLRSSLAGFDKNPTAREVLGDEGYKKYLKANAEYVSGTESTIFHFSAELSNPPEEIAKVAADFWQPKAMMASAKPKAAAGKVAEVKPAAEKPKP
jgi:quinol monooxygenase YgiN